jgi:hypothetical protein
MSHFADFCVTPVRHGKAARPATPVTRDPLETRIVTLVTGVTGFAALQGGTPSGTGLDR